MDTVYGRGHSTRIITIHNYCYPDVQNFVYADTNLGFELTVPCPEDDQQRSHTRRSSSRGVRERLEVLFAGEWIKLLFAAQWSDKLEILSRST